MWKYQAVLGFMVAGGLLSLLGIYQGLTAQAQQQEVVKPPVVEVKPISSNLTPSTASGYFKVGDRVCHVMVVNFSGIPAYFRPHTTVIGTVDGFVTKEQQEVAENESEGTIKINLPKKGNVIVRWDNGQVTEVAPLVLAKCIPNQVESTILGLDAAGKQVLEDNQTTH